MRTTLFSLLVLAASTAMAQQPVSLPYTQRFDSPSSMSDFYIVNANDDDDTWSYNPMMHCAKNTTSWSPTDSDDWLILPLKLEAKASYTVSFVMYGASMSVERFDLWLGTEPTKAAMTRQLMETKEVKVADQNSTQRTQFSVDESGIYYLAFHDCTEVNQGTIFLDDIEINEVANTMPAAPTGLTLVPGEKGKRECNITFTLPTTTLQGKTLDFISEARIYRNDILAKKFDVDHGDDLTPGTTISYHDTELSNRLYTYKIVALSENGEEGGAAMQDVYVGLDRPKQITNLEVREDVNRPGTILLTWDAPTEGEHGGYIDPKGIYYTISKGYDNEFDVRENHYEDHLPVPEKQSYVAYSVYAQNEMGGTRSEWLTMSTQYGPAEMAPWSESFPNATIKNGPWLTHVTGTTAVGDASWYTSTAFDEMPAQDDDFGYTYFFTSTTGKTARFVSPKVDIRQLASPTLSFWLYEHGDADVIDVAVLPEMQQWEPLGTITLDEEREGWRRYTFDLSAYRNKQFVQVGFEGTSMVRTSLITALDNVSIRNNFDRDLAIVSSEFPKHIDVGDNSAHFKACVRNEGNRLVKANEYTISLYRQEAQGAAAAEQLATFSDKRDAKEYYKDIDVDAVATFELTYIPTIFDDDSYIYYIKVDYDGDENPANDATPAQEVRIVKPNYPVPDGLAATCGEEGVQLSWNAPAIEEGTALPVTDTFEEYGIFDTDGFGDWTVYDADGQYTVTMAFSVGSEIQVLDYPHIGEPMAWQCFSPVDAGIPYTSWMPHSDDLMMVAMGNAKNADGTYHDNDDWLISPELSGRAQTITFYAKCGMGAAYQPEVLEVLATDQQRPAAGEAFDVTQWSEVASMELYNVSDWDEYAVTLPEGTKHFALRCRSQHKFALLIDDVTFQPAGAADIVLLGYNVYRDNERLNAELLTAPAIVDTNVAEGSTHTYVLTAVYNVGESVPTAPITVTYYNTAGISECRGTDGNSTCYDISGKLFPHRSAERNDHVAPLLHKQVVIEGGRKMITTR